MNNISISIIIFTSFFSFIFSYITKKYYEKKGWLDDPKKSSLPKVVHNEAIPRGGGIPIFFSILFSSIIFLPIDKHLIGILSGAFVLMILGIWDDLKNLNPKIRLIIGFFAASFVVGAGIGIAYFSNPFSDKLIMLNEPQIPIFIFGKMRTIWILADLFALLWIVSIMNFVNWSKGLDGQLPGMVVIASFVIAILSNKFSADITQWGTEVLALIVGSSYLGFLVWNFYPQKMMPGYGGGTLAGYFLAVMSILSTTKVGTLTIVLGIPLIDAIYVMLRRIFTGKSPLIGDTRHLHHSLMKIGWGKRRIAVFYWLMTFFLGILALSLNSQQKFYTIILLFIGFGGFLLWMKQLKIYS